MRGLLIETKGTNQMLTREYLEDQIAKSQAAIAFASPNADLSYAKAKLTFAQIKLAQLDKELKPEQRAR